MNALVPYIFFLYMFVGSWILLMNYKKILNFSKTERSCCAFICTSLAIFSFIGAATIYHLENLDSNFKELIKDVC
uniref:Uncharacterized protein n=1 Tax=viral metagenome TaxID=1070528 RepID=A0A6C0BCV7_9ZZZZ